MTADTHRKAVVERLREGMARGVLSFPLTSFHRDGSLDLDGFRTHVAAQIATGPGAVFPACGTGEFFSLDEDEYRKVVAATVEEAAGRVPVVAGIGYGWAQAARFARIAEEAAPTPCWCCRTISSPRRRTGSSHRWSRSPYGHDCPSLSTSAAKSPSAPSR